MATKPATCKNPENCPPSQSTTCADSDRAPEDPGFLWNDPDTRRRFLKRSGGATAATMLAQGSSSAGTNIKTAIKTLTTESATYGLVRKYLWIGILVLCAVLLCVRFVIYQYRLEERLEHARDAERDGSGDVVSTSESPPTPMAGRSDSVSASGPESPAKLQLEGPKAAFEAALKQWESAHREVLRNVADEDGQSIVLAMPAPPDDAVATMLAGALRDIPEVSRRKAEKELRASAGDYIRFSGATSGKDYWDHVGAGPTYRILYIDMSDKRGRLSVAYTDTLDTPAEFWREGMETAAITEAQIYGRLTPSEAKARFGHLFEIEGFEDLRAFEGSPERYREKMQEQRE